MLHKSTGKLYLSGGSAGGWDFVGFRTLGGGHFSASPDLPVSRQMSFFFFDMEEKKQKKHQTNWKFSPKLHRKKQKLDFWKVEVINESPA